MVRHGLRAFGVLFVMLVVACSGGATGSGCGAQLPGGFPKESIVPNGVSARLTRPGLDFLANNFGDVAGSLLGAGNATVTYEVPQSTSTVVGQDVTICPTGSDPNATPPRCTLQIDLKNSRLKMDALTPNAVRIQGTMRVRAADIPIRALGNTIHAAVGRGTCSGSTPNFDFDDVPFDVTLPLVAETRPPRDGYTKVDAKNATISLPLTSNQVGLCCDLFGLNLCNPIKDFAFNTISNQLQSQLRNSLDSLLCTAPDSSANPVCPNGSHPDASRCVFNSDPSVCVPRVLGAEGHMTLEQLLSSVSPGAQGAIDYAVASGGNMMAYPNAAPDNTPYVGHSPNGITLGFLGGVAPVPVSNCVPATDVPVPTGIEVPTELTTDVQSPWPPNEAPPHVGIALAGRFLNYALGNLYRSGTFCLGITTEQFPQLESGLFSLLVPSLTGLASDRARAPLAVVTRPQAPPKVRLGGGTDIKTDPLITVDLPQFTADFYIWSYDRFVLAFSFTSDLSIPINLQTGKSERNPNAGLLPVIGSLSVTRASVSKSLLLVEDPNTISNALTTVLGTVVSQAVGRAVPPIDLAGSLSSLGVALRIPDGGIRRITKGQDDFLAVFAGLATVPKTNASFAVEPRVYVVDKEIPAESTHLTTLRRETSPRVRVAFSSSMDGSTKPIEFAYRVDEGVRSAWSQDRDVVMAGDDIALQGRHRLRVYARVVGDATTESIAPAEAMFTLDSIAPHVTAAQRGSAVEVTATDFVSSAEGLQMRFRRTAEDTWTEWRPYGPARQVAGARLDQLEVEVKDEEGNVGRVREALIRGHADKTLAAGGSGCGCSVPRHATPSPYIALLAGLGVAFWARRRSRTLERSVRALAASSIVLVGAGASGCDCGSEADDRSGCGQECNAACEEALPIGIVGAYTSVAKATDGTIWVAGYNDGSVSPGQSQLYGDLVAGKFNGDKGQVEWQTVDGLPLRTEGCPDHDRSAWRKGENEPGDNVGRWSSIALDRDEKPLIAYYNATGGALKFAKFDGTSWESHEVMGGRAPALDAGRYAKLFFTDHPVIVFLAMELANGKTRSRVVIANATTPAPKRTEDWVLQDALVDENGPCRPSMCPDRACLTDTGVCTPLTTGCTPADCGNGNACVSINGKAQCAAKSAALETYPNAVGAGLGVAKAPGGMAIVAYDRVRGNLMGLSPNGATYNAFILDGQVATPNTNNTPTDTGDMGASPAIAVGGNGEWHVAYVDGFRETLKYLVFRNGRVDLMETIDDGFEVNGAPFPDGKHIVGDDAVIRIDGATVTVAYQDATAGTLRLAQRTNGVWTRRVLAQPGRFAGFFPQFVPGENRIATFWRSLDGGGESLGDVALVAY